MNLEKVEYFKVENNQIIVKHIGTAERKLKKKEFLKLKELQELQKKADEKFIHFLQNYSG